MNFVKDMDKKLSLLLFSLIPILLLVPTASYSDSLVPAWVKNTAKWYGEDKISEKEFVNAIEFLIKKNIIKLTDDIPKIIVPKADDTKEQLVQKGIEILEAQDYDQALVFFNKALEKDPEDLRALVDKGVALAKQGKFKDANEIFTFAIKVSEKKGKVDYAAVTNAGIVLSIYGDPGDAIKLFDRVIENKDKVRQETLVASYVNKGVTVLNQGKHEESLAIFDKALEIEPNRLGALINKANALQELGRLDEAAEYFHRAWAIDKDPLSWTPRFVIVKE